jgi:hypothetical protein
MQTQSLGIKRRDVPRHPKVRPLCIACWLFARIVVVLGLIELGGFLCGSHPSSLKTLSQPLPTSFRSASIFFLYISPLIRQSWLSEGEILIGDVCSNGG